MASASATCSISGPNYPFLPSSTLSPLHFQIPCIKSLTQFKNSVISCSSSGVMFSRHRFLRPSKVRAVADEEEASPPPDAAVVDQTVSVSVSPSDVLTMFFQAEGIMDDSAIPAVTQALKQIEGISDLKVQVLEGIASVELAKQTTIQASGVASNLVETIQGSGFKLQTLNLSFQDEEVVH